MADAFDDPPEETVTPKETYLRRRELLRQAGIFTGVAGAWGAGLVALSSRGQADPPPRPPAPPPATPGGPDPWAGIEQGSPYDTAEVTTPFEDVTTYNNYYELGLSKSAPAKLAGSLKPRPWTVKIIGHVKKEQTLDVDDLIRRFGLEQRIYRMRCVEAWSMVIPWVGFPLKKVIDWVEPTSRAKYVQMKTLLDPEQLPGQRRNVLDWPYTEALRMDEAAHPLTLLATGLYDAPLLGQNGAPLRLVVPWKYGFKGVKSIVEIAFVERQPQTTWNRANPREYGFYANVNPNVPHPRWSQATERRIGELSRIKTKMFNGYGDQVADLYAGMDLERNF